MWQPAHGAFAVPFVLTIVVFFVSELRQSAHRRQEAAVVDHGSRVVIRLAYLAGAIAAAVVARTVSGEQIRPIGLAAGLGLAALWAGIGLRQWSFRTLGHYFTFVVQTSADQPVIDSGPYRLVRHPSYAGVLLIALGIGFFLGNWIAVPCLVAGALIGVSYRIHVEEQALVAQLGDRYREFAASRKRLVPFVW